MNRTCPRGLELNLVFNLGNFAYQGVLNGIYHLGENFGVGGFKCVAMFIGQHNVFAELVCTHRKGSQFLPACLKAFTFLNQGFEGFHLLNLLFEG